MSTIDLSKRMQKWRTEEEIRKALQNCIHGKVTMCVPPQIENLSQEQKNAVQEFQDFVSLVSFNED